MWSYQNFLNDKGWAVFRPPREKNGPDPLNLDSETQIIHGLTLKLKNVIKIVNRIKKKILVT